jgi:uracil-DNA glycosylase
MVGTRDIRSFFGGAASGGPAAKKQRTMTTRAEDKENAAAAQNTADEKDADAEPKDTVAAPSAVAQDVEPAAEAAGPLEHKLKNLQHNARFLMHESWYSQLESEFARPYFKSLVTFLSGEEAKYVVSTYDLPEDKFHGLTDLLLDRKKTIYPTPANVFAALRDCAFDSLKVVIIGQDPYHGPNQAHGLSFSVLPGVQTPPSLVNIYKEAMSDVKLQKPNHGCLSAWSQQGVLMLNAVLTVRRGEPNSHKNQGWEKLTDAIIDRVNKNTSNVVFLLWGRPAQLKGARIDKTKHLVITSSHPSPLGATKTNEPFIGSKCFSKTNAYLQKNGKDPIDWHALN